MISNIQEDNKDVDSLISYLESIIVKLRRDKKLDDITLNLIKDLFENEIQYYTTQYYLPNIEINTKYEQQIRDIILDMINILNKL
jgi:hypothetical protein